MVNPTDDTPTHRPLNGLGLFNRASGPHAVSVAIDLGLHSTVPQADRPWACRISTPLQRPGPDGLARDVREIERLAELAKATVGRLAAVFAAAVTTDGTRTWLLYAAGADAAATLAAVRSAADSAFTTQVEYVPTVAVKPDPTWDDYLSLYPTPTEAEAIRCGRTQSSAVTAARAATKATVQSLRAAGVDLTRPAAVRYRLDVPQGTDLLDRAAGEGMQVDAGPPLTLVRQDLPDLALILRTERWLIHEAARVGGGYRGWSPAGGA